jgi:hypothetical protein
MTLRGPTPLPLVLDIAAYAALFDDADFVERMLGSGHSRPKCCCILRTSKADPSVRPEVLYFELDWIPFVGGVRLLATNLDTLYQVKRDFLSPTGESPEEVAAILRELQSAPHQAKHPRNIWSGLDQTPDDVIDAIKAAAPLELEELKSRFGFTDC